MTPKQLADAQHALLTRLKAAGVTLRAIDGQPVNGHHGDEADRAVAEALTGLEALRRESTSRTVAACLGALARIEAGVYGVCERCERPISAARLKALPEAACCIDCAQQLERAAADARAGEC